MGQVCKQIGVTEQTCYRWRKEYGGLRLNQAKRLKVLEKENARLKKLVADLVFGQADSKGSFLGKLLGPAKRRRAVVWGRERLGAERVCERRACQVLGQARSTAGPQLSQSPSRKRECRESPMLKELHV